MSFSPIKTFYIYLFYAYECFVCVHACMYVHHVNTCCPWNLEEDAGFPGTRVIDSCVPRFVY